MLEGRLYVVEEVNAAGVLVSERLVKATSASSAVRFCAGPRFGAVAAKSGDVARLMSAGALVEEEKSE